MNTHQNSPVISAIYKGFSKLQNEFLKSAYLYSALHLPRKFFGKKH